MNDLTEIIECYEREYGLTNYMYPLPTRLTKLVEHLQERGGSERKRQLKADLRNAQADNRRFQQEINQLKRKIAGADVPNLVNAVEDIERIAAKWRLEITKIAMNVKADTPPEPPALTGDDAR